MLSGNWKEKNKDSIKYAGDGAKKSIDKGLKQASTFMADADEGTSFEDVQNASVKWELANNSNNRELSNKARNEMIGHLSKENKEIYLKDAEPLQKYIDAKDEFDYKNNNYTTTEFIDTTPNEDVRKVQRELNELGYTDKFGEPLKEDGIFGGKTRYAKDNYEADNGYKPVTDYELATQKYRNSGGITSRSGSKRVASEKNKTPVLNKKAEISNLSNTYTHESGVTKWRKLPDITERMPKEYKLYQEGKISKEIYNAMDTLSQRWYYADTLGAREEISNLAQSVRNNDYKVKDCTKEANKQLRDNRNSILDYMKDKITENEWYTLADYFDQGIMWYKDVDNYGAWDYKTTGADWIPKEKYFMYHGQIINSADFGNINYGYTGTILGLHPETLYKAGGELAENPSQYEIINYYSDSEVDHYWIKKGIEQANSIDSNGYLKIPVKTAIKAMKLLKKLGILR